MDRLEEEIALSISQGRNLRLRTHTKRNIPNAGYQGPVYETLLNLDPRWALSEGSRFFEGQGAVQDALKKVTNRLNSLGIPYAVAGGMALFRHGYHRFTEDIDLLVLKDDLKRIHAHLDGLGYLPPFTRSKNLRDTELGIRIEFLVTGEYPGDGRPKPVAFPEPLSASFESDGIRYLSLDRLVELKLASGMTEPGRMKDLSDVLELIKILNLPRNFSESLSPYVQEKYAELWASGRKRYLSPWRNKWLTAEAKTIEDMIDTLRSAADELERMKQDGVSLDPEGATSDDYAHLITTDLVVAKKYGFEAEDEYWGEDGPDEDLQDGGPEADGSP